MTPRSVIPTIRLALAVLLLPRATRAAEGVDAAWRQAEARGEV